MNEQDIFSEDKDSFHANNKVIISILRMIDEGIKLDIKEDDVAELGGAYRIIMANMPSNQSALYLENVGDVFKDMELTDSDAKKAGFNGITLQYLVYKLIEKNSNLCLDIWSNSAFEGE